jgi:hypothetical protein
MTDNARQQRPFGTYLEKQHTKSKNRLLWNLIKRYKKIVEAGSFKSFTNEVCSVAKYIDGRLDHWPAILGGKVTPFSTFRGYFLEEVTLEIARRVCKSLHQYGELKIIKLPTGSGVVTGIALAFRRDNVPNPLPVKVRRDREDVIVGLRRTLRIESPDKTYCTFPDEIIPICILACKIYIDATRLENVLAKAKNMYELYSTCAFVVVAEWDALGKQWHDNRGRVLESLYAPVSRIVFFRGQKTHRPKNAELKRVSLLRPYLPYEMRRLYRTVKESIQKWYA